MKTLLVARLVACFVTVVVTFVIACMITRVASPRQPKKTSVITTAIVWIAIVWRAIVFVTVISIAVIRVTIIWIAVIRLAFESNSNVLFFFFGRDMTSYGDSCPHSILPTHKKAVSFSPSLQVLGNLGRENVPLVSSILSWNCAPQL
jgi:hypothetical protein